MLTAFGKALRKIRIDRSLRLKDMADALSCSSPFLSAIESGNKNIPADMIDRLSTIYSLNQDEIQGLREGAELSQREVRIGLTDVCEQDRELVMAFARSFDSLDERQKERLRSVLKGGR